MEELLLTHEGGVRLGVFAGALAALALAEALAPRRARVMDRAGRWATNLAITVIDAAVLRVFFPVLAVGVAVWAEARGVGLLNLVDAPRLLEIVGAVIVLDCLIYWQHVFSHRIPLLWRFHRMHHVDRDIDATTAVRFHPVEIAFSMLLKMAAVAPLGPAPAAVIVFEILLNATAIFNHANLALPRGLDRALRLVLVTPDMHRVHHSVRRHETDSNFGFNLPWWDRLFGTYRDQPEAGHDGMTIGLAEYQTTEPANLLWSLRLPFAKDRA